jgi:hypothetical protein
MQLQRSSTALQFPAMTTWRMKKAMAAFEKEGGGYEETKKALFLDSPCAEAEYGPFAAWDVSGLDQDDVQYYATIMRRKKLDQGDRRRMLDAIRKNAVRLQYPGAAAGGPLDQESFDTMKQEVDVWTKLSNQKVDMFIDMCDKRLSEYERTSA